jgi:hypothetical protein
MELRKHSGSLAYVIPYTGKTVEEIDEITEMLVGIIEEFRGMQQ